MASPHRSQVLPLVVLGTPEHPQGRHSALPMLVSVQGWAKGVAASKLGRLLVSNHPKRCAVLRLVSISSATRAHEEERKHRYLVYPRCASHRSCALLHHALSRSYYVIHMYIIRAVLASTPGNITGWANTNNGAESVQNRRCSSDGRSRAGGFRLARPQPP